MLKKMYKKNGMIYIPSKDSKNIKLSYYLINNYDSKKKEIDIIKEYYKSIGYEYNK